MKNKVILIIIGALIGVSSFLLGVLWKEKELSSYLAILSVTSDSFRIATNYDVLKKFDEGREQEAIDTLRGWMETDILIINSYRDELSVSEQKRIDGLLKAVEPYREKSNRAN